MIWYVAHEISRYIAGIDRDDCLRSNQSGNETVSDADRGRRSVLGAQIARS